MAAGRRNGTSAPHARDFGDLFIVGRHDDPVDVRALSPASMLEGQGGMPPSDRMFAWNRFRSAARGDDGDRAVILTTRVQPPSTTRLAPVM